MPPLEGVVTTVTVIRQSVIGMVLLVTSIERYYYNGVNIYRTEPVIMPLLGSVVTTKSVTGTVSVR